MIGGGDADRPSPPITTAGRISFCIGTTMVGDGKIPPASADFGTSRKPFGDGSSVGTAFAESARNVAVAWAAAQTYLSAQADRLKLLVRTGVIFAIVGLLTLLFVAAIFVTAAVLLMLGAADAIARLLGGQQWAGDLITGAVVVLATVIGGYVVVARMTRASRLRTMASYQSAGISN